jgi:hypothetical protein
MNRNELALRAEELAGGETGYVHKTEDPLGYFAMVTEGRQAWKGYSACQDLASRLALEACELKQGMKWCNRVDGGNKWIPGENLIRIKKHAGYAWRNYTARTEWDIQLGDAVEIMNRYGPHTFVVTRLVFDKDGTPALCDHADYGQNHDPDDFGPGQNGPEPSGPSCRVYRNQPIAYNASSGWAINGHRIIGRLDIMALRTAELSDRADTEPGGMRAIKDSEEPTHPETPEAKQ